MKALKDVIRELRLKHGNQTQVAEKIGISSQLLGQYERGKHNPKLEFFESWLEVYGEDIRKIQKEGFDERNVSHETGKGTHEPKSSGSEKMKKKEEVYKTIVEGNTEYVLIPRKVMDNTRLVSADELDRKNEQINFYQNQLGRLLEKLELQPKPPDSKEVKQ